MLSKGVLATLGCNQRCTVRLELVVSRATQRAYRLPLPDDRQAHGDADGGKQTYRDRAEVVGQARSGAGPRSPGLTVRATWTGVRPAIVQSGTVRLRR